MKRNSSRIFATRISIYFFLSLLTTLPAGSQELDQQSRVPDEDVQAIVARYPTGADRHETFLRLRSQLPKAVFDTSFRARVIRDLPEEFTKFELHDEALTRAVLNLFAPVLNALGRAGAYDLVILDHDVPLVMIDTDSVIVLTTGWFRRLPSEDAALGFLAHEIGHRLFEHRMVAARQAYEAAKAVPAGRGAIAESVLEMARIELECDAFSAVVLSELGYDATEFTRELERITEEFGVGGVQGHPAAWQRDSLVRRLSSPVAARHDSNNLLNLKTLLPASEPARERGALYARSQK